MTLLVDDGGRIAKIYDADHWLLPLSRRVYVVVDPTGDIVYRKDMGFALLPDQTKTLLEVIDRQLQ